MPELSGRILTPTGLLRGTIRFDRTIERIVPADVDGPLILPGFIDVHVHGGGGGDTMQGAEGVRKLARFHLAHGTTTLLPTTVTNPWERLLAALDGFAELRSVLRSEREGGYAPQGRDRNGGDEAILPDLPGIHLEGPFISRHRLGAQAPFPVDPDPDLVAEVIRRDVVRVVTIAPELPGARVAAQAFARAGVRVSVGHTVADYDTVLGFVTALRQGGGVSGFTHLFNAMGGLEGRQPGVAGAALSLRESYAELIFDTHHVHAGALHAARAAKGDRLLLVTDCIAAGGMGDGETELGGLPVTVADGAARLTESPDTLAGSVLTLDAALRNALAAGVPLAEASQMLSRTPARYLGLGDRGELARGLRADLVALDDEFRVTGVYVEGREAA